MSAVAPVTCVCGRDFKNRLGFNPHARVCPAERKRSDMFVTACETGDWSAYYAEWRA